MPPIRIHPRDENFNFPKFQLCSLMESIFDINFCRHFEILPSESAKKKITKEFIFHFLRTIFHGRMI